MYLLVIVLLLTQCLGGKTSKKNVKMEENLTIKARNAFKEYQPLLREMGMTHKDILARFKTFRENYRRFEQLPRSRNYEMKINNIALLTKKEQNKILGRSNQEMKLARSGNIQNTQNTQLKIDPEELNSNGELLHTDKPPNTFDSTYDSTHIATSTLFGLQHWGKHSVPNSGGYAWAAAYTIDLMNILYWGVNLPGWNETTDGYYEDHVVSRAQLINCVYRDHGYKQGSPADAFQWISDHTVMKSHKQKHINIQGVNNFKKWHLQMLATYQSDKYDPDCISNRMEPEQMTVMQNVTFLPGKAYVNFGEPKATKAVIDATTGEKDMVMGEKLIKPLVYKKGAVLIALPYCPTLYYYYTGIYDVDCSESKFGHLLPMWLTIIGYSRTWFRMGGNPRASDIKVSRLASDSYVADWNRLILPRLTKYTNCGCQNGGRCTADRTCYCSLNKVGDTCADDCTLSCQNGGFCRGSATQCHCPDGFSGPECEVECNCGKFGRCESSGVCTCPRQVSYGTQCQNMCLCQNQGYCHQDGSCECLAGKAGTLCTEECTKVCTAPLVCRYTNHVHPEDYCGCPFGFYGKKCENRVNCDSDIIADVNCVEKVVRYRCDTDAGRVKCPLTCGHCLWLRQIRTADTKK